MAGRTKRKQIEDFAHEATHKSGGNDAFLSTDFLEAIVKRLQETGGPTTLLLGAIPDGQLLQRSGANILGVPDIGNWGNTVFVDAVNGNDGTGIRGDQSLPFLTVAAALAAALVGDFVYILAGTYSLAAGITIPTGVSVSGESTNAVMLQMLLVTANTTLVTMGSSSRLENVTLKLTSAQHHTLTGVLFPGTTSATAKFRTATVTVDESTAGGGASNVTGVLVQSTGAPDRSVNSIRAATITVNAAGTGTKRGILMDTSVGNFSTRDTNVIVTGSGIGVEVNIAGSILTMISGLVSGTTTDIAGTAGTLEIGDVVLVSNTITGTFTKIDWANQIRETGGPTILVAGAIADGQFLKRSGSTLVGSSSLTSLNSSIATATANTTTTGNSDALVNSMTLTPAAGTYLVWFTGSVDNNATQTETMSIYSGGSLVTDSPRIVLQPTTNHTETFCCVARVTVNGAQAIEGRWKTDGGTATMHQRSLAILQVA